MVRPVTRSDPIHPSTGGPFPVAKGIFSLQAPAKINWFLHILGKRQDGYHDIVSLMQCVSLYDELTFEQDDSITIESDLDIPVADNLIYRAASLLKQYAGYEKGARIILRKQIPVSAGLGGGSSDAACTLSGLNALWGLGLQHEELQMIGARIGSDIPFFFHPPAALVEGKGNVVKPLQTEQSFSFLLVKPDVRVSTAWAYGAFDQTSMHALTKKPIDIKLFCQALQRQDFLCLANLLFNDLEEVVIREYPAVREIKQKLIEAGAEASLMSGSGPTVFGVFKSRGKAEKAFGVMRPNWCRIVQGLS
jgi:4-diphosphocytidyl-2-C-methyl-D-erythritol kinase